MPASSPSKTSMGDTAKLKDRPRFEYEGYSPKRKKSSKRFQIATQVIVNAFSQPKITIEEPKSPGIELKDSPAFLNGGKTSNPLFDGDTTSHLSAEGEEEFGFSVEETYDGFGGRVSVISVASMGDGERETSLDDEEFDGFGEPSPHATLQKRSSSVEFGSVTSSPQPEDVSSAGLETLIINGDPFALEASSREAWMYSPSYINEWIISELVRMGKDSSEMPQMKAILTNALNLFSKFDAEQKGELDFKAVQQALKSKGTNHAYPELKDLFASVDDDFTGTLRYREFANLLLIDEGFLLEPLVDETEPIILTSGDIHCFPNSPYGDLKDIRKFMKDSPGPMRKEGRGFLLVATDTRKEGNKTVFEMEINEGAYLAARSSYLEVRLISKTPANQMHTSNVVNGTQNPVYNARFEFSADEASISQDALRITVRSQKVAIGMFTIPLRDIVDDEITTDGWMSVLLAHPGDRYYFRVRKPVPSKVKMALKVKDSSKSRRRSAELLYYQNLSPPSSPEDMDFKKVLGKGSFGKVFLAFDRTSKQPFAVKVISKALVEENESVENLMVERRVLALPVRCPFVPHLFCCFQTSTYLFFVMEVIEGGNLAKILKEHGVFSEKDTAFYVAEILNGLWFMHQCGVLYRDLKLENILLDSRGHVKLADFGLAKDGLTTYENRTRTLCGTPSYLAPELIEQQPYGTSVDIWALGIVTYILLTGSKPYRLPNKGDASDENLTEEEQDALFDAILGTELQVPASCSQPAKEFLCGVLEKDPLQRLGCHDRRGEEQLKSSAFLQHINWDKVLTDSHRIMYNGFDLVCRRFN
eukprot:m.57141 g.57141  ORF g.57141 m.57141 type:complete len:816 (+) comp11082_c0_seq1:83-2530(+)